MKWLGEKYNIVIIIQPDSYESNCSYIFGLWEGNKYEQHLTIFTTYEDAVEAALKYALKNIITKENKQ